MPKNIRVIDEDEEREDADDSEGILSGQHLVHQQVSTSLVTTTNSHSGGQPQQTYVTVIPSSATTRWVFPRPPSSHICFQLSLCVDKDQVFQYRSLVLVSRPLLKGLDLVSREWKDVHKITTAKLLHHQ